MYFSVLFLYLCYALTVVGNRTEIYSSPPSHLPTKRIYIHGRPVYIRQMFVSPLRSSRSTEVRLNPRKKRCPGLFGAAAPPPAAPAYAPAAYAPAAAPAYSYQYYQSAAPAPAQVQIPQQIVLQQPIQVVPAQPPAVAQPPLTLPQPPPPPPPPTTIPPPPEDGEYLERPEYPLPECYTDDSNFMCCNNKLEQYMKEAFIELKQSRDDWTSCNIQQIAHKVQLRAEKEFNTNFEVISGVGDYASKSHFYSNLICKIEREGKFILAYATPRPDDEEGGEDSGTLVEGNDITGNGEGANGGPNGSDGGVGDGDGNNGEQGGNGYGNNSPPSYSANERSYP